MLKIAGVLLVCGVVAILSVPAIFYIAGRISEYRVGLYRD